MTTRHRSLLVAALGFATLDTSDPKLQLLHRYLDSWHGVAAIVVGMQRVGYDLQPHRLRARELAGDVLEDGDDASGTGCVGVRGGGVERGAAGGVGSGRG
jgi:hypothetical protein